MSWHDCSASLDPTEISANSDHCLCTVAVAIPFRPVYKHKLQPAFNAQMLTDDPQMALHYNISIENMFSVLGDLSDIEVAWTSISDTIRAVIKNTIGYKRPHRKPWLSEEAVDTINAKA